MRDERLRLLLHPGYNVPVSGKGQRLLEKSGFFKQADTAIRLAS